jgi:hypothetical protein
MPKRKHISDIAIGFYSDGLLLLHPKDLHDIDEYPEEYIQLANRCHIYLIVTRPRVFYVPGSVNASEGRTRGRFRFADNGTNIESTFSFSGEPPEGQVEVSPYPHTKLLVKKDSEVIFTLPAHIACMMCEEIEKPELRFLKVRYVGMSYADGTRSARDRLASHSTLQRILADLNGDEPDQEVLLLLAEFASPQTMISLNGRDPTLRLEDDRDVSEALVRQASEISKGQEIALIEAGLIRYFRPKYNDKYKETFPAASQKILAELYSIDFSGLTVEINTESVNARLFSEARADGAHHIAYYDLHDLAARRSFFDLFGDDESAVSADKQSGPIF